MKATMFHHGMDSWLQFECQCGVLYTQRIIPEIDLANPLQCPDCGTVFQVETTLKVTPLSDGYTGSYVALQDKADELPEGHRYYRNPSNERPLKT